MSEPLLAFPGKRSPGRITQEGCMRLVMVKRRVTHHRCHRGKVYREGMARADVNMMLFAMAATRDLLIFEQIAYCSAGMKNRFSQPEASPGSSDYYLCRIGRGRSVPGKGLFAEKSRASHSGMLRKKHNPQQAAEAGSALVFARLPAQAGANNLTPCCLNLLVTDSE